MSDFFAVDMQHSVAIFVPAAVSVGQIRDHLSTVCLPFRSSVRPSVLLSHFSATLPRFAITSDLSMLLEWNLSIDKAC